MSRRYTKRKYRKSSRRKYRSKLRGGSKKPKAFIYTHLGLGDMCLMIGAVRYLATKYDKVTVVCKKMYEDTVKGMYADDPSIQFHMVSGDEDMKPWKEKAKKYESEGYDVYGCGMFSLKTDGKIRDFPNSFYDDLEIPRTARKDNFRVAETGAAKSLHEAFKGRPYIVVHQTASNTKLPILEKLRNAHEKRLIIDVNKNQVDKDTDPEGYALAEKCVNRPFTEYVKLFEGADELHMIDSAVFCFAMHLDLSRVKKRVYYIRPGGPEIDNFGKFEEGTISQAGGASDKEYVAELICDVSKEKDRLEKLKPILEAFHITPSYYVDKTNVHQHPLYSKFNPKSSDSEKSLTINHVTNLQKHKDSGKFVLMFEIDVTPLHDFPTLMGEIDKTIKDMKEKDVCLVYLGNCDPLDISKFERITDTLYKTLHPRCTDSYLISPKCINKYIDYVNNTNENITPDWNFNRFFKDMPDLISCWRIPELFKQDRGLPSLIEHSKFD